MSDIDKRLQTAARDALKLADDNVEKAAVRLDRLLAGKSDLRVAMALFFINAMLAPAAAEPAQPAAEPAEEPKEKKKKEPHSRRKQGPHRRPGTTGMPTTSQRKAEIGAAVLMQTTIWDRKTRGGQKLGDIKIRELPALMQETGQAAGSFVSRGYEDAVDAIWCRKVSEHAVLSDPDASVRDCVNDQIAAAFLKDAKIEAAQRLQAAGARIVTELTTRQPPPPPEIAA